MGSVPAIRRARQRIEELVARTEGPLAAADVFLVAYLDDVLVGVPATCFAESLSILQEELRTVGHHANPQKLEVWTPSGIPPPRLPAEVQARWRTEGLTVLGLPIQHPPAPELGRDGSADEEPDTAGAVGADEASSGPSAARGYAGSR